MRLSTEQTAERAVDRADLGVARHRPSCRADDGALARGGLCGRRAACRPRSRRGAGFTSDIKIADGEFLKNIYGVTPNAGAAGRRLGHAGAEPDLVQAVVRGRARPWRRRRR